MYISMYVYVFVCIYAYTYICIYVYMCKCICIYIYIYMYTIEDYRSARAMLSSFLVQLGIRGMFRAGPEIKAAQKHVVSRQSAEIRELLHFNLSLKSELRKVRICAPYNTGVCYH